MNARKALLIEQRARMAEMQRSLDQLNDKTERYEQGLMAAEKALRE